MLVFNITKITGRDLHAQRSIAVHRKILTSRVLRPGFEGNRAGRQTFLYGIVVKSVQENLWPT